MIETSISSRGRARPAFLASVRDRDEAALCLRNGAEIIDCKDPSKGALGALDAQVVRGIVEEVGGAVPVSATVGDLPIDEEAMGRAVETTAATGVDIVKVGFIPEAHGDASSPFGVLDALGGLRRHAGSDFELVAVFFADTAFDFDWIAAAGRAGFAGVMLDTADKSSGSLFEVIGSGQAAAFVSAARACGLAGGLAGRLRKADAVRVAKCGADIIGFRSALCVDDLRDKRLDADAVSTIRRAIETIRHGAPCPEEATSAVGQDEAESGSVRA